MVYNAFLAAVVLLVSSFYLPVCAQPSEPICLAYSRIANMSTIGSNSTYRSAFIQASPDGTTKSLNILAAATLQLPPLTINAALNQQCGNLTTVALTEAEKNFTQGIVAQFSGIKDPQHIFAGILLMPMICIIGLVFYGVWSNA